MDETDCTTFMEDLPPEKQAEGLGVQAAVILGECFRCKDYARCSTDETFKFPAVRFPDGSDFAQHHGTYGGTEGCVEPAIGDSEFDYTAVGLNLAKELVKKHKGKLGVHDA